MAESKAINPKIFGAYDVRGIYPETLDEDVAYRIGRAFVQYLGVQAVAVGRDMRVSSPALAGAVIRGITDQGADAIDLGMTTTDELYFAVGKFGYPAGVMVTASHNPKQYNGLKMCREEAIAISSETGGNAIRDLALAGNPPEPARKGQVIQRDVADDYVRHALSFIDVGEGASAQNRGGRGQRHGGDDRAEGLRASALRVDPALLRAGRHVPEPSRQPHRAGEYRAICGRSCREQHCDMGVAFDGDADRMFLVDEQGKLLGGDMVTALVAQSLLRKHPGATILYNLINSRSVPELIERDGGRAVRTRVGHSFIKAQMREENAIFGGEHSGHFYFRDNWYADSGLIAFLVVLELISESGKTVSELVRAVDHRFRSGEINTEVADQQGRMRAIEAHYAAEGGQVDFLDGITVSFPTWWFNVRPSNTEPLLRLNLEADTADEMAKRRDEVLQLIRQ